jgi:hypothetical protein
MQRNDGIISCPCSRKESNQRQICLEQIWMRSTRSASAWMARVSRRPGCRLYPVLLALVPPYGYSTRVARRAILGPLATRFIHETPLRAAHSAHPCASPLGARHANRLSCRFVSAKAAVLGAANGIKSSVRNIS